MASETTKVTFNQKVKHGAFTFEPDDKVTISKDLAEYFLSNGWIEGDYDGAPIINPNLEPEPSKDILLDIQSSTLGTVDSNG